ncbi:MAG: sigma 54-interacting transcriptional regulator [Myxococcales bacterium]|nr:sigma 54-interacting transcriptional regulator [Myxococcales bacterium]
MIRDPLEDETRIIEARPPRPVRLQLLVFSQSVATYPLPAQGSVVLGRSGSARIRIEDPSVSREHARLHIGETLEVEDLGSANGTWLRQERLAPGRRYELAPGDTVDLGAAMVMVQKVTSAVARPRRLWNHGYFEARVEDECARAERSGGAFAVVRVHLEGGLSSEVQDSVMGQLRPADLVAAYGPDEYELMLVEAPKAVVEKILSRIAEQLSQKKRRVRFGVAMYPADARSPEALIAKACDGVRPAPPRKAGLPDELVIEDPAMRRLYQVAERVATSDINVLLLGETGSGKEVLAEWVHQRSPRRDKPLLRLNCAALTDSLVESELFGHEKGSFTGAVQTKIGLLESAEGGTVFLDEIGELPMQSQGKLLRVIEDRKLMRIGGLTPRAIDVHFLSATNRDLEAEVARGAFRQDLYFRLAGISLAIPPLRERAGEVERLSAVFVAQACRRAERTEAPVVSTEAMRLLTGYSWPGNIRELRNVIDRAVLLCTDGEIRPEHLPLEKMGTTMIVPGAPKASPAGAAAAVARAAATAAKPSSPPGGEDAERRRVVEALDHCAGNQTRAAKLLGISRRTLVTRLDRLGLPRPRKR